METRGVWITNTDSEVLRDKQSIAKAMDFLALTGFNVVFPVVWNKGVTVYPSQVMGESFGIEIDPRYVGRDPLAELIDEARRVGIKVIPWFEYGFASSYNLNGGLLLAKKPEWAARDCTGNLLKKNGFEWMNALDPQVQEFLLSLVLEVVKKYDIDGIQGDDRLPALPCEGGYDEGTVDRYRKAFNQNPPQNPRNRQWLQWRADILTDFLARLYQEVKAVNPDLLVSMAPNIYDWSLKEYLQDSQAWLKRGLVDLIHPQIYRRDFESYGRIVDRLVSEQFTALALPKLAPGILVKLGSYRITPEYLLQAIEYNRSCGIQGEVLFFYEGLREDKDALGKVLQTGPYAKSSVLPSASALSRGGVNEESRGRRGAGGENPVEYQSQVERVIETLKKDLPTLFEKDISYDIYTKDIYFQDPVNKFKGKTNYRIIFWTLRFHGQLFFPEIYFDLHDVYQAESDTILANWTVRGVLRVPWKARVFFNGYSTYKLNKNGLIYDHIDTWDRKPSEILKQFLRKGKDS